MILSAPGEAERGAAAQRFCAEFLADGPRSKYLLGRNVYAESVARHVDLAGFVDDFTSEASYLGQPVIRSQDIPADALVLNAAGGRPLSAKRRLDELGLENLDYFAFAKYAGLPLIPVVFNEGFSEEFQANEVEYRWIEERFYDELSCSLFRKLTSFRLKYDLELLRGFEAREHAQYFEDFLDLQVDGEGFVDVGGYDGATSREFMRLCPGYRAVHVFEPEPQNYRKCVAALGSSANVRCHPLGLSDAKRSLRLMAQGSGSKIVDDGAVVIEVDRLDDVLEEQDAPTLIKIDIEGEEAAAIEGARRTIAAHHPRLAICVYHRAGDFWRIPRQVLAIRDDYDIYLRHYTESIYETVMFFMPRR
ncbi:MAG: FkbM family methyltransferase [Propionivibrio sp.]|nr:FkbM family methyltransferase [Propionivibrio sp.]